jgi:molybdate transport repressor ModE-like protein
MDTSDFHLFVQIAQCGSLSGAARQAGITAAGVSARLKRMEGELQVRLVERTTRSARLTAEGERFLQTCEAMAMTWARGKASLRRGAKSLEGQIRLAAPSDTSMQMLCPWLADYGSRHPGLRITVLVADRMHDVNREAVDVAIRYGELEDSSMVSRLLCQSDRVLVAAPSYLARAGKPSQPADLTQHRCLAWLRRDQPKAHWSFGMPDGRTESVVVDAVLCGDGSLVRSWALCGAGIAYKARADVLGDLRDGRLVQLLPHLSGEAVPISAVILSRRYLPARVRSLLQFLVERFAQL